MGGRWYLITQLVVYTTYSPCMPLPIGFSYYMLPTVPPNQETPLNQGHHRCGLFSFKRTLMSWGVLVWFGHGGLVGKSTMDVFLRKRVFGDLKLAPGTKKEAGIPDSKHHFCGSFIFLKMTNDPTCWLNLASDHFQSELISFGIPNGCKSDVFVDMSCWAIVKNMPKLITQIFPIWLEDLFLPFDGWVLIKLSLIVSYPHWN